MNTRLVPTGLILLLVLLGGCSPRQSVAPSPSGGPASASAEATRALSAAWTPVDRGVSPELVGVVLAPDGTVVQDVRTVGAARATGKQSGTWRVTGAGTVVFEQREIRAGVSGAVATYRFVRTGGRVTLTWVSGKGPGGDAVSAGPVHFGIDEGDSWVTGSHAPFALRSAR